MEKEFFENNRRKYFNEVMDNSVTVMFSGYTVRKTADEEFDFEVDKNFYYLTGIKQNNVILVLSKINNKNNEVLFIEENDEVLIKWVGAKLYKPEAKEISGIDDIQYMDNYPDYLKEIMTKVDNVYLNFEARKNEFNPNFHFSNKIKNNFPNKNYINNDPIVVKLRSLKEKCEIDLIKESIETTKKGLNAIMANCKSGMYEYELENYFDFEIKKDGNKKTSFNTIAAGGVNGATLHYTSNDSILNDGELVLFDLGCETEYYISDISRTYPVNGKFKGREKEVYEEVLNVNKKCIEFLKEGITLKEYNEYANSLLAQACINLGLIKDASELNKYYFHSIGHSIGLDTHDPCCYNPVLKEGMVITCEPGLYIKEEKIGVRIEDDILITKDGNINLSKDIIKETDEIEEFFAKYNK